MSWRGSPSRCSASAPTPTSRSSSTTAWRSPSASAPTASISANRTATSARRGRCSAPRRRSARPATTAAISRWRRGRRAPIMSRSALSIRPRPSRRTTGPTPSILTWWSTVFEIPCVAIGGITPDNAKPLIDAGADFLAVCQAVWGSGRSGRGGSRLRRGARRLDERRSRYHFVTIYLVPSTRPAGPRAAVHGFGLPSSAMLFQISSRPSVGAIARSRYLKPVAPPLSAGSDRSSRSTSAARRAAHIRPNRADRCRRSRHAP